MLILDRDKVRRQLFRHYKQVGLKTKFEVRDYVEEYLHIKVPDVAYCAGHDAPLQMITDFFFEEVTHGLGWANRTGGKTMNVAILNHLDMEFKPKVEIAVAAATLSQAKRGYSHISGFYKDPVLRRSVDGDILQSLTKLKNGSRLEIITGTVKGVNAPHPHKVRLDEVELMKYEVFDEAQSMSMSKGKYKQQDLFTSTRKKSSGLMQRLIDEAPQRGIRLYNWCIWDVVEKCTRQCQGDKKYGDCPIFDVCKGVAHEGRGWYKISDLIAKFKVMSRDVIRAQWLNLKPGMGVLVYPYEKPAHSIPAFTVPKDWPTYAYIDFGSNFYYGKIAVAPSGHQIVYYEYWWPAEWNEGLQKGGPRILEKHAAEMKKSERFRNSEPTYADPEDKQSCTELVNIHRVNVIPADKSVSLGLDNVRAMMEKKEKFKHPTESWERDMPLLLIMQGKAPRLEWELENYQCEINDDGTPNRDEPDKESAGGAHGCDGLRYGIRGKKLGLHNKGSSRYRMKSVAGL